MSAPQQQRVTQCATHGRSQGYIVCTCIAKNGAAVVHLLAPDKTGIGEILCSTTKIHLTDQLILVCEHCAKAEGWTTARPTMRG